MWDENNNEFTEIEDDGFDIEDIFASDGNVVDPFANLAASATPVASEETDTQKTEQEVSSKPTTAATTKTTAPQVVNTPSDEDDDEAPNPIAMAIVKQTQQSLFDKPAIFAYGSAKEDIEDGSTTFEELRIAKAEDFPELSEGKKVSWTVEYGKITKTVSDPKGTTIISMKEEIERSKAFLDSLKKAKDKNPSCLIKPKVTAQSKGQTYKGMFPTQAEAVASDKVICLFPAQDGRIYELRKTEMGDFVTKKNRVSELSVVRAGFTPALPLIPQHILSTVIAFFRRFMARQEYEALAHIYWDREQEEYTLHIPKQTVSKVFIHADLLEDGLDEARYLHYADIHSHNSMAAKFSSQDDRDEQATRLYFVVGRLDKFFPDITARICAGGVYQEIDPALVLEPMEQEFPCEWLNRVTIKKKMPKSPDYAAKLLELAEAL
ncbi:hypothetical protein RFF05_08005 [Bengtsoniella intestinalis]|uniref:hypothetical protein n=1 Tax=Bengtsoniella intestinalis TaxID=3073143 RepID=UPI00391FAFDD